jgi:acetyl esterase
MSLDPQVQAFLEKLAAAGAEPPERLPLAEARRQMEESTDALGKAPPVRHVADLRVPGPAGELAVRIYRNSGEAHAPGVVYFHGGGWVIGSIHTHDKLCRELAVGSGAVVASVDYRLAPEHKYPAAAEDAYAATCWVASNAAEFGIDPSKVVVAGDSAGGNLAAVVCLMARDRRAPRLAKQVLIYPITDYNFETPSYRENGAGYYLTGDSMRWFWREYLARPEDGVRPYASPLRAAELSGLPPTLVLTAEFDPLRDEGEAYARRLTEAGVLCELIRGSGLIHGFLRRTAFFDAARPLLRQICHAINAVQAVERT